MFKIKLYNIKPFYPEPQVLAATHVVAEFKNKLELMHSVHFEASIPIVHFPTTQELSQF